MCRYGMTTYKPHYACFNCCKTFKRRLLSDIERGSHQHHEAAIAKCPQCGGLMADMGLDFESPKRNDTKTWQHIRNLYTAGITFHSCGCSGPGYIPKDHEALLAYLEQVKNRYIDHWRFWQHRVEPTNDSEKQKDWNENMQYLYSVPQNLKAGTGKKRKIDPDKAIDYWAGKIKDVERKIKELIEN